MTVTWQFKSLHAQDNLVLVSNFRWSAYPQEAIAFQKYAYIQYSNTVKYTPALVFTLLFPLTVILILNIVGKGTLNSFNIVHILTEI